MERIKIKCVECGNEWIMSFPFGAQDCIDMGFIHCTCKKCGCKQSISKNNAILLSNQPIGMHNLQPHPLSV